MKNQRLRALLLTAMLATCFAACQTEDPAPDNPTDTPQQTPLCGTEWSCHIDTVMQLYGIDYELDAEYILSFTNDTAGYYFVAANSTYRGESYSNTTSLDFTYDMSTETLGTLHFALPDDTPDYVRDSFESEQGFEYDSLANTIIMYNEQEEMVFHRTK